VVVLVIVLVIGLFTSAKLPGFGNLCFNLSISAKKGESRTRTRAIGGTKRAKISQITDSESLMQLPCPRLFLQQEFWPQSALNSRASLICAICGCFPPARSVDIRPSRLADFPSDIAFGLSVFRFKPWEITN
jgi:hypothetical protein